MISHGRVLTATVSIALILRNRSAVANFGREEKMENKEVVAPMSELSELINRGGLIDDFKTEESKDEPPTETIKLADWLIDRGLKDGIRLYGKSDLRKLANYLLIYCGDEND